jgi:hypothetical protein
MQRKSGILSVIIKSINYLDEKGLDTSGIFRELTSNAPVDKLKERFDKGEDVNLNECQDPCVIAALLKVYLKGNSNINYLSR